MKIAVRPWYLMQNRESHGVKFERYSNRWIIMRRITRSNIASGRSSGDANNIMPVLDEAFYIHLGHILSLHNDIYI